jgi:hypothetical protein
MLLSEGQVWTGQSGGGTDYSGVASCLTVTCLPDDGSYVGGHLRLLKVEKDSTGVLLAMQDLIGGRKVSKVVVAGQLDTVEPGLLHQIAVQREDEVQLPRGGTRHRPVALSRHLACHRQCCGH